LHESSRNVAKPGKACPGWSSGKPRRKPHVGSPRRIYRRRRNPCVSLRERTSSWPPLPTPSYASCKRAASPGCCPVVSGPLQMSVRDPISPPPTPQRVCPGLHFCKGRVQVAGMDGSVERSEGGCPRAVRHTHRAAIFSRRDTLRKILDALAGAPVRLGAPALRALRIASAAGHLPGPSAATRGCGALHSGAPGGASILPPSEPPVGAPERERRHVRHRRDI